MKETQNELLTREQCTVLKGFAILLIMLHNMCHLFPGIIAENEFSFDPDRSKAFFSYVAHPDADWPLQLLSYLGHYGMPVFIFLSAYGLVKKYENLRRPPVSGIKFIASHYWKIFLMCLTGIVLVHLVTVAGAPFDFNGITDWQTNDVSFAFPAQWVLEQLSLTINFLLPFSQGRFAVGPYWYLGFVLQLYILYRVFLYTRDHDSRLSKWGPVIFVVFAVIIMYFGQYAVNSRCLMYLRYNFFGGAIPFGMGLLVARYERHLPAFSVATLSVVSVVSIIMLAFSNLSFHAWMWSGAFAVAGLIALVRVLPAFISRPFYYAGVISMPLFLVHPVMRLLFRGIASTSVPYQLLSAYVVISLVIATMLHLLKRHF